MEGGAAAEIRNKQTVWKKLKKKLKLKNIFTGLCGSSSFSSSKMTNMPLREEDDDDAEPLINAAHTNPPEFYHIPSSGGTMNLATALAAERQLASAGLRTTDTRVPPLKSLMTLFEEIDGAGAGGLKKGGSGNDERRGIGKMCCLCMERNKGAALIPCGHTYCRACSRNLWLNQGSCPLCNRSIIEILDIF